jgi:NTE family protein
MKETGQIAGFIMPYLGQIDERLPYTPNNLVMRNEKFDYPTDFSPMKKVHIERISLRGEQLTRLLIEHYKPNL